MNDKIRIPIYFTILLSFFICVLSFGIPDNVYALNLEKMKTNMLLGDYKSAITEGEKLIAKDPHSDELYYLLGLCYLKDGNYLRASDIFEVVIKEFKGSKFKEEATMGLGDTYLLREDFDRASSLYLGIIKDSPKTKLKPQLYYRISEIGFKKGDVNQGKEYLTKLREGYSLAPEAKQGQDICPLERNNLNFYYSVQIGSFSNPANAQNLNQKLLNSGYSSYIEESLAASGLKTYRVKVGKLASRQEAENLNKKLKTEGYPTKICP
ncbi:MAG: SPOR domain-containing protein [Candidatus Omnitrophica bacterium]|nr:SPOR domain-containing protein [Candidatus Omnitrophota bacterium]